VGRSWPVLVEATLLTSVSRTIRPRPGSDLARFALRRRRAQAWTVSPMTSFDRSPIALRFDGVPADLGDHITDTRTRVNDDVPAGRVHKYHRMACCPPKSTPRRSNQPGKSNCWACCPSWCTRTTRIGSPMGAWRKPT
jgi:hypothetical protein